MSPSWLEELEARLEEQLEDFLRANPRQEELLAEQEARDRQLSLRQERLALQQQAEATRQRLLELAREIRLWQQRRDKASAAGATELATKAAAHLNTLMEQGRGDWQSLTELGQRFASVEAALDALNQPGDPAQAARAAAPGANAAAREGERSAAPASGGGAPRQPPPAHPKPGSNPSAAGSRNPGADPARQANSGRPGAAPVDNAAGADTTSDTNRHELGSASSASGAPGTGQQPLDPALDLEAAWHAFATQQELEELRRRVGS